jgi:hypothetical protein
MLTIRGLKKRLTRYYIFQAPNGGIITANNPEFAGRQHFVFTSSQISPQTLTLWGDNSIVGRYILIAGVNGNNGVTGGGGRILCGEIVEA